MYPKPKKLFCFQLTQASCEVSQGVVSLISSQVTCMGAVLQLYLTLVNGAIYDIDKFHKHNEEKKPDANKPEIRFHVREI